MLRSNFSDLRDRIERLARHSALGGRVRDVLIEADADEGASEFLRVVIALDDTADLQWSEIEPLVRSIEDAVASMDERFPRIRFAEAA